MAKSNSNPASSPAPVYSGPPLRANVAFDLTADELEQVLDACADAGLLRLAIRIAERKGRLLANIRRMEKEAAALQQAA